MQRSSPSGAPRGCSAEEVLQKLAPHCVALRRGTLKHEGVWTADDLAVLGREDLRELGLNMAERSRVLRWARRSQAAPEAPEAGGGLSSDDELPPKCSSGEIGEGTPTGLMQEAEKLGGPIGFSDAAPLEEDEEAMQSRLDQVEQAGDFWCTIVKRAAPDDQTSCGGFWPPQRVAAQRAEVLQRAGSDVSDLREDVLEAWYDLTPENINLVYQDMLKRGGGEVSLTELGHGLQQCGMPGLGDVALKRILEKLGPGRGGRGLRRAELDVVLSRLKLAHILADDPDASSTHQQPQHADADADAVSPPTRLWVVDYNTRGAEILPITEPRFKEFFFGHRPRLRPGVPALVRWVHCCGCHLKTLLALTVKYGLHPLAVEDMVEQCPTKIDQYGSHHFVVVQVLMLASPTDGTEPVQVRSLHVSCSCSGVGLSVGADTLITVTQPDKSFEEDWPGGVSIDEDSEVRRNFEEGRGLLGKLRHRLKAPRSKLREHRADFLMHQIIDLCADALVDVKSAFLLRLNHLEEQIFFAKDEKQEDDALAEVTLVSLQLGVLSRRLRGLQRLLRHAVEHPDLGMDFPGYFQDVKDGVEEALDDAAALANRCNVITEQHDKVIERRAADRLNNTLFVLTGFTTIMSPIQLFAGVYGMNFVNSKGTPTIPELLVPDGYFYFWLAVVVYLAISISVSVRLYRRWLPVSVNQKKYLAFQKKTGYQKDAIVRIHTTRFRDESAELEGRWPSKGGEATHPRGADAQRGGGLSAPLLGAGRREEWAPLG